VRPDEARSASKQDFFAHIYVRFLVSVYYRTNLTEDFSAVVTGTRRFDEVSSSRAASTKFLFVFKKLFFMPCS